ncbi:unnamed protein product [Owenia fusiformis]|uniref:t-SNARE coiled-coil homology domain-containing protein n=1 Tax=Owenia fusiformis TaxID=6347 RepID=A0A8S4Q567_OWEFU|nr:unnamed protein product [Owenia fusiformis]
MDSTLLFCVFVAVFAFSPSATGLQLRDDQTDDANGIETTTDLNQTILDTLEEKVMEALYKISNKAIESVKKAQDKVDKLGDEALEIAAKLHKETDQVDRIQKSMNEATKQIDKQNDEVIQLEEKYEVSLQSLRNTTADLSASKQKIKEVREEIQNLEELCPSICKRSTDLHPRFSEVKIDKAESSSFLRSPSSRTLRAILDNGFKHNQQSNNVKLRRLRRGRIREWIEERREGIREKAREIRENIAERIREKGREIRENIEEKREWLKEKALEGLEWAREKIAKKKRNVSKRALCNDKDAARQQCREELAIAKTTMEELEANLPVLQTAVDAAMKIAKADENLLNAAKRTLTDLEDSMKRLSDSLTDAESAVDDLSEKEEQARIAFDAASKIYEKIRNLERFGIEVGSKINEVGLDGIIVIKRIRLVKQAKADSRELEGTAVASFFGGPDQSFLLRVRLFEIEKMVDDLVEKVKEAMKMLPISKN